jgi:hypothetical protein
VGVRTDRDGFARKSAALAYLLACLGFCFCSVLLPVTQQLSTRYIRFERPYLLQRSDLDCDIGLHFALGFCHGLCLNPFELTLHVV